MYEMSRIEISRNIAYLHELIGISEISHTSHSPATPSCALWRIYMCDVTLFQLVEELVVLHGVLLLHFSQPMNPLVCAVPCV